MSRDKSIAIVNMSYYSSPESDLAYCAPQGHFFMGAKLFLRNPSMRNKAVLNNNLFWLCVNACIYMANHSGFEVGLCLQNY